jgi:hypothetical protein
VPPRLRQCLTREFQRRQLVARQISALESERRKGIRDRTDPQMDQVRRLLRLKGIGKSRRLIEDQVSGLWEVVGRSGSGQGLQKVSSLTCGISFLAEVSSGFGQWRTR